LTVTLSLSGSFCWGKTAFIVLSIRCLYSNWSIDQDLQELMGKFFKKKGKQQA
jgi:hypothetical protein